MKMAFIKGKKRSKKLQSKSLYFAAAYDFITHNKKYQGTNQQHRAREGSSKKKNKPTYK